MSTNEEMTAFEESILFYYEIGHTITQWAHVETGILSLNLTAFHNDDRSLSVLNYYSIENFRSKLQAVDAVLKHKYQGTDHLRDWTSMHARATSLAQGRNRLAHRGVMVYPHGRAGKRYALVPWTYARPKFRTRGPSPPPPGSLFIRDIAALRLQFFALCVGLENLHHRILGLPEQIQKSLEQPANPPSLRQLARLLHANREPLDKS